MRVSIHMISDSYCLLLFTKIVNNFEPTNDTPPFYIDGSHIMNTLYVPMMKLKRAEMKALAQLTDSVKEAILPVVQILPDTNLDRKNDYLKARMKELVAVFSNSYLSFYADFDYIMDNYNAAKVKLALVEQFLAMAQLHRLSFIPVFSLKFPEMAYAELIKEKYLQHGICLKLDGYRIKNYTVDNLLTYLEEKLEKCKLFFNLNESQIDVLFDLEEVGNFEVSDLPMKLIEILSRIKNGSTYRKLIIAAGSFPKDLNEIEPETERHLFRHEWELWKMLQVGVPHLNLVYSDYGNIYPGYDPEQGKFIGTCSVKYTLDEVFLILRGRKPNNDPSGNEQYVEKSKILVSSINYDGEQFCWGDKMISEVAQKIQKPGNATSWIQYTFNHHISKIVQLLRTS